MKVYRWKHHVSDTTIVYVVVLSDAFVLWVFGDARSELHQYAQPVVFMPELWEQVFV